MYLFSTQPAAGEKNSFLSIENQFLPLKMHVFQRKMKWEIPKFSGLRPGSDVEKQGGILHEFPVMSEY